MESFRQRSVQWMDYIKNDAAEVYFLGDIFDFWYEYKKAIPKGFTRFLGKLLEFHDSKIPVYYFTGNHDVWSYGYLNEAFGVTIYNKPVVKEIAGKKFFMAHGDGLGPGDKGYLILKWAFNNKVLQWMFSRLHPNFALGLGQLWSKNSRLAKGIYANYQGKDEWLIQYAQEIIKKDQYDYFVFGHRHLPIQLNLNSTSEFICLGDWIVHFTYAVFDGDKMQLKTCADQDKVNIIRSIEV